MTCSNSLENVWKSEGIQCFNSLHLASHIYSRDMCKPWAFLIPLTYLVPSGLYLTSGKSAQLWRLLPESYREVLTSLASSSHKQPNEIVSNCENLLELLHLSKVCMWGRACPRVDKVPNCHHCYTSQLWELWIWLGRVWAFSQSLSCPRRWHTN